MNTYQPLNCDLYDYLEIACMHSYRLQVELVDIAESEAWVEAYALRIPVLKRLDSAAELGWPFDASRIAVFLGLGGAPAAG